MMIPIMSFSKRVTDMQSQRALDLQPLHGCIAITSMAARSPIPIDRYARDASRQGESTP